MKPWTRFLSAALLAVTFLVGDASAQTLQIGGLYQENGGVATNPDTLSFTNGGTVKIRQILIDLTTAANPNVVIDAVGVPPAVTSGHSVTFMPTPKAMLIAVSDFDPGDTLSINFDLDDAPGSATTGSEVAGARLSVVFDDAANTVLVGSYVLNASNSNRADVLLVPALRAAVPITSSTTTGFGLNNVPRTLRQVFMTLPTKGYIVAQAQANCIFSNATTGNDFARVRARLCLAPNTLDPGQCGNAESLAVLVYGGGSSALSSGTIVLSNVMPRMLSAGGQQVNFNAASDDPADVVSCQGISVTLTHVPE
jgi:hypothetical protein